MNAVVTGMIAAYPVGGVAWDYGQYVLGLGQLGFDVTYLEDTGWWGYDPERSEYGPDQSYGADFLERSLRSLAPGLGGRWHLRAADGRTFGMAPRDLHDVVADADLFLNVSGGCLLRPEYVPSRRKVLIDTDPGWNHFVNFPRWDENPGWQGSAGYRAHDHYFTYAERIGASDCPLPSLDLPWRPTRPPVVLDRWAPEPPGDRWTTVMTWDNFRRPIQGEGVTYGTKELEFGRVESLPTRSDAAFEVAVGGSSPPADRWRSLGWTVKDSHAISRSGEEYRSYLQSSRGEFSVAKNVYVATRSGWFSCRSVCYLAAGRPVAIQDTGFSEFLPTGKGLLSFSTLEDAEAAIRSVESEYEAHAEAAREVAASHFDAERVLSDLVERIGL